MLVSRNGRGKASCWEPKPGASACGNLNSLKFSRQMVVSQGIVDFCCCYFGYFHAEIFPTVF